MKRRQGFTLLELIIVIAVIGMLAAVIMPRMNAAREKALVANAQAELNVINTMMGELYSDTLRYPNGAADYCRSPAPSNNEVDLSSAAAGLLSNGGGWANWNGPYLDSVTDPWGNPYYLDEDYRCLAATEGCNNVTDAGNDSSVLVSCGLNGATAEGACAYDDDNIVLRLCGT